jgi:hypothetical protein
MQVASPTYRLQGGVKCATVEQLKLVLTRANSLPLKLSVQWPAEPGTLELLASLKYSISSLTLLNKSTDYMTFPCFRDFNFASLQELRFEELGWYEVKKMLDGMSQAHHSVINKIKLYIHRMPDILRVLGHQFFQRVIEMRIRFGQ